jgi:hypothetical protein
MVWTVARQPRTSKFSSEGSFSSGGSVYVKLVAAISAIIFATAAVIAAIVTDLHDRTFPSALGISARATLDFSRSGWADAQAFSRLAKAEAAREVTVYKVSPDLGSDRGGQVLVGLRPLEPGPRIIPRFGAQADSRVQEPSALQHSFASGDYVLAGDEAAIAGFRTWATGKRLVASWSEDDFGAAIAILFRQSDFAVSATAAVAVMLSLVLFWLAVRARGRALRVLAGASPWRIHAEDLKLLTVSMLGGAVVCTVAGVVLVWLTQGWTFVPYYARCVGAFVAMILGISVAAALFMSLLSWPSPGLLARRRPAVGQVGGVAALVKAATFVMVIVSVGPALSAYLDSSLAARQQATWQALADRVGVIFPAAGGEDLFTASGPAFRDVVADAEKAGAVSLAYTMTADPASGIDLGAEPQLTLVDDQWLRVVVQSRGPAGSDPTTAQTRGFAPVAAASLNPRLRAYLDRSLPLWLRTDGGPAANLAKFRLFRWMGEGAFPAIAGGSAGDLAFLDRPLLLVQRELAATFTDDFLMSAASTQNLVFTGVAQTEKLLAQHGLGNRLFVKLVAEDGLLRAQYTAYFAWLRGLTVVAMVVALSVATAIGAVISAMTNARNDFALRVSGATWWAVLCRRLALQWFGGLVLAAGVLALTPTQAPMIIAVTLIALLLLPIAYVAASRWSFTRIVARQL